MNIKSAKKNLLSGGTEGWDSLTWPRLAPKDFLFHGRHRTAQFVIFQDSIWRHYTLMRTSMVLTTLLTRYMIRVRKVKGGGSKESGSKNWIARYKRAYLRKKNMVRYWKLQLCMYIKESIINHSRSKNRSMLRVAKVSLLPLCVKSVVHFSVSDCKHDNQDPET